MISFDEKRYRSQLFGLSRAEERVRWEQWIINLHVNTNAATSATMDGGAQQRRGLNTTTNSPGASTARPSSTTCNCSARRTTATSTRHAPGRVRHSGAAQMQPRNVRAWVGTANPPLKAGAQARLRCGGIRPADTRFDGRSPGQSIGAALAPAPVAPEHRL